MSGPPAVYLSYASHDAGDLPERLRADLEKAGVKLTPERDAADVVLALLSPASLLSPFCRAEQIAALGDDKRVILVLAQAGVEIPFYLESTSYLDFSNPSAYPFEQLLAQLRNGRGATLKAGARATLMSVPLLPDNLVPRREPLETLRNALLSESRVVALTGMAGIGKTVVAAAICRDDMIQQAFPEGIFWSDGDKSASDLPLQPRATSALIVLDNVSSVTDVPRFVGAFPICRFLITTRDRAIAADLGAQECEVPFLTITEYRRLLGKSTRLNVPPVESYADEIARLCGYLPSVLAFIAGWRGEKSWQEVANDLRDPRSELNSDLFRILEFGMERLDAKARERYGALAFFGDFAIPVSLLAKIWQVNEAEAGAISERFVQQSLALRIADSSAIQLHPVLATYLAHQFPAPEDLALIRSAVQEAANVIGDSAEFAKQIGATLAPHRDRTAVQQFLAAIAATPSRPDPLIRTMTGHAGTVNGVAITPDGPRAVSASGDHSLKLWDLESGRELRTFQGHTDVIWWVTVTPDGELVLSASQDRTVRIWGLESGRLIRTLEGHRDTVWAVAVTSNARTAVSVSQDGTLARWSVDSGQIVGSIADHSDQFLGLAVSPDGKMALTASKNGIPKLWDLDKGTLSSTLKGHTDTVWGVAITPNGKQALTASADKTLKLWDLATGQEIRTFRGHTDSVVGVAITPDGRRAVSASSDSTLKLWDLATGRALRTLGGHSDQVRAVDIAPDGTRALSGSADGTLKLWDIRVGAAAVQPALPASLDRLRFAYLATLDRPELYELLDHFDPVQLQEAYDHLSATNSEDPVAVLQQRFPDAAPNPLWQAWIEAVRSDKLGQPEKQLPA